jgi:hypothetical protein
VFADARTRVPVSSFVRAKSPLITPVATPPPLRIVSVLPVSTPIVAAVASVIGPV